MDNEYNKKLERYEYEDNDSKRRVQLFMFRM